LRQDAAGQAAKHFVSWLGLSPQIDFWWPVLSSAGHGQGAIGPARAFWMAGSAYQQKPALALGCIPSGGYLHGLEKQKRLISLTARPRLAILYYKICFCAWHRLSESGGLLWLTSTGITRNDTWRGLGKACKALGYKLGRNRHEWPRYS